MALLARRVGVIIDIAFRRGNEPLSVESRKARNAEGAEGNEKKPQP